MSVMAGITGEEKRREAVVGLKVGWVETGLGKKVGWLGWIGGRGLVGSRWVRGSVE